MLEVSQMVVVIKAVLMLLILHIVAINNVCYALPEERPQRSVWECNMSCWISSPNWGVQSGQCHPTSPWLRALCLRD